MGFKLLSKIVEEISTVLEKTDENNNKKKRFMLFPPLALSRSG